MQLYVNMYYIRSRRYKSVKYSLNVQIKHQDGTKMCANKGERGSASLVKEIIGECYANSNNNSLHTWWEEKHLRMCSMLNRKKITSLDWCNITGSLYWNLKFCFLAVRSGIWCVLSVRLLLFYPICCKSSYLMFSLRVIAWLHKIGWLPVRADTCTTKLRHFQDNCTDLHLKLGRKCVQIVQGLSVFRREWTDARFLK